MQSSNQKEKEVKKKLKKFVEDFVSIYEGSLSEYYDRLVHHRTKPGKWADFVNRITETGKGGTEAIDKSNVKGSAIVVINILQNVLSAVGSWHNRKELKKLLHQLYIFKEHPDTVRQELVKSGVSIFRNFESQFVQVTSDGSWERAMTKLAEDAVNRVIIYHRKNTEEEFSAISITKSIFLGHSKKYKHTSTLPHIQVGHTLQDNKSYSWNTADLFDKTGLVSIRSDGTLKKYYNRRDRESDTSKYGYRLCFEWEDIVNEKYQQENPVGEEYKYILNLNEETKKELEKVLLDEINNQDPKLMENRLKEKITQSAEEDFNKLKEFVSENFDNISDYIEEHQQEIKEIVKQVVHRVEGIEQQNKIFHQEATQQCEKIAKDNTSEHKKTQACLEELPEKVAKRLEKKRTYKKEPVWFDVRDLVISFTALSPGRQDTLEQIETYIKKKIVVISGLSGIGKSELAIKHARSQYSQLDSVVWIDAKTCDTAKESFRRLSRDKLEIETKDRYGEDKNIKAIVQDVYKDIVGRKNLFIIDNAEKYTAIEEFLPLGLPTGASKPDVLITSPNNLEWESDVVDIEVLPALNDFTEIEATVFLKKALKINDDSQDKDILELTKKLHNFPLILQQVAVYIKNVNKEYKKRNSEFKIVDYNKLLGSTPGTYLEILSNIWKVTFDKIKNEEYGEIALIILNIMSYLEPNHIPEKMFLRVFADGDQNKLTRITSLPEKYSIVRLDKGILSIHGLVQEVIRCKERQNERKSLEDALKLLKELMEGSAGIKSYIPHIISVWKYAKEYDTLIENFIINDNSETTYLRLITEGSSYAVVDTILTKIEKKYPNELKRVINAKSINGKVPLHYAIRGGNDEIIKLLIEKGADIDASDKYNHRPLHLAARHGYFKIVEALLDKNADVNAKTSGKYQFTPLHLAAQNCHTEVVIALLEKGADVNSRTQFQFTPLHLAAQSDHLKVVIILLDHDGIDIEAKTGYQFTPLHLAAEKGHLDVVQVLISKDADINALDRSQFTALHIAAQKGYIEVVSDLLKNSKIKINAQTTRGNTPLHLAAENGHLEVVMALIVKKVNVDVKNEDGEIAADLAAKKGHLEVQNYIIENSMQIESPNQVEQDQNILDLTFEKTPSSIDGQLYEMRLSTLLLLVGMSEKVDSFYLASNIKEADKLDDIVFKYKYTGVDKWKIIFLQAKHRSENKDTEKNKITINQLFPKSGSKKADFSLDKYFSSYLKIKQKFSKDKVDHPIFGERFEDSDCDFIIYTNALPCFNKSKGGIEQVHLNREDILNFSEEVPSKDNSYYKIVLGEDQYLDERVDVLKHISSREENIKEFLSKLKLFVGQPSQNKLAEMIKQKIKEQYKVAEQDIDSGVSDVESKILTWWNRENYYLTKENRFFQDTLRISIWFDVKEPVDLFTGRKEELFDLHNKMQRNSEKLTVLSHLKSVSGLGGIGKTELARKYIQEHAKNYDDNIVWISAESEGTLIGSFRRLAQDKLRITTKNIDGTEKDIKSIVEEVYKFFAKRKSLFIFDNAVEIDYLIKFLPLRSLTPDDKKPNILITSRNREWGAGVDVMDLNELKLEEAIEFVKKGLNISQENKSQDEHINTLVVKLQCFPLAIQQAISYIDYQGVTGDFDIIDYLEEYEKMTEELLDSKEFKGIDNQYTRTTFTTWKITIEKIASNKQYGQVALKILNAVAYIAPENIMREMLLDLTGGNERELKSAVRLLVKYSMVNGYQKQSVLSIHRLVQEVTRIELKTQTKEQETLRNLLKLIKGYFFAHAESDWGYEELYGKLMEEYDKLPDQIANRLNNVFGYEKTTAFELESLRLMQGKFNTVIISTDFRRMLRIYCLVEIITEIELKEEEKENETLKNIIKLVKEFNKKKNFDHAVFSWDYASIYDKLVEEFSVLPNRIINVLYNTSRHQEVYLFGVKALKLLKNKLDPDHPDTLNIFKDLHNKASELNNQGFYDEAMKIYQELHKIRKEVLGPDHLDTLEIMFHMAALFFNQRKFNEAYNIFKEVLEKRKEKLGLKDTRTKNTQALMDVTLSELQKYEKKL